jgi:hypothetical protein
MRLKRLRPNLKKRVRRLKLNNGLSVVSGLLPVALVFLEGFNLAYCKGIRPPAAEIVLMLPQKVSEFSSTQECPAIFK